MSKNFKKMLSYYKPYRCIFWADMFFATVSAAVALAIPLVIRYVTYTLVYEDKAQIMFQIKIIAAALFAMVAADCYSKFFISNYGHVWERKSSTTCVPRFLSICRNYPFRSMITRRSGS